MSISPVGSLAASNATNTISVSPTTVGDILVLGYADGSSAATAVSGGGVATWTKIGGTETLSHTELWYGVVVTAGASSITVTNAGASYTTTVLAVRQFTGGTGGTWAQDPANSTTYSNANVSGVSGNYPSMIPAQAGELYLGIYAGVGGPIGGATAGFTYSNPVGSTGNETTTAFVYNANTTTAPQSPAWSNGTSAGWGATAALLSFTPALYTVTFSGNGNTGGAMSAETAPVPMTLTANAYTKTGYSFVGWNSAADGSGTSYPDSGTYNVASNITLYAQWSGLSFTVAFNANGGSGTMASETGSLPIVLNSNTYTRAGFTFGGWNSAADGSGTAYADGASYSNPTNATLYAQWVGVSYTVVFNGNGNTGGTMASETAPVPFTLNANTYTRAGYTFTGWNSAADGSGTAYAAGGTYASSADATLYAQWTPTLYTITFNGNGSTSGTMSAQSGYLPITLTANAFVRTGYTFLNWNTAADGSGSSLADGAAYNLVSNNTLYAIWAPPSAPAAPTLGTPANASYLDVAAGVTFGPATYNSTDGNTQTAYALRVKTSAGSYQYWNAGTAALQSTIVWNTDAVALGGTWSVAIPAGVLADGNIYNWSLASQESTGLQGPFATDFTFTAQAAAVVTVTAPTGTITVTTEPTVSWTNSLPSGAAQTGYQVIVESGAYGAVPGTGAQAWDSGAVASAATTTTVGVPLATSTTYRVFVQVTETGGEASAWAYTTFTLQANSPAPPIFAGVAGNDPATGAPIVTLTVNGQDNWLTENQSSLELGATTGWVNGANTTIAASNVWAMDGTYSLAMTATAAGGVGASTPSAMSGVPVTPGQIVRAMASFHSPASARACTVGVAFYNSAGTYISTLTSTSVTSTLSGNGGKAFVTGASPAGAAFAALVLNGAALGASEILYADEMLLAPGASATWSAGGFIGTTVANFYFSDDNVNWFAVRGGSALPLPQTDQTATVVDYEGSLGFGRYYQAQVTS